MAAPLLTTKYAFPPALARLVPRPRLVARLQAGLSGPLTLISAPAGYGKTSLLSEWRAAEAGRGYPLAWLSLDPEDNEAGRFLAYLVSALGAIKPGCCDITLVSLQSPGPPPPQTILTNLINELSEFEGPFALVLDDYHVITTQAIHEALTYLLEHMPAHMHLVILSRADPPLPLARLRVRNQLTEIRAAELRFTPPEAQLFLDQMGVSLSAEDFATLERRTEGWIAGLQLAALSLQDREDPAQFIANFGGGNYYIVDYLVEEVLSRQPEALRSFLLQTSLLERLTGPLCEQVTGQNGGQLTLEYLERANLFITPLGGERCWYRYHRLFADVMQNRLRQLYPEQLEALHLRAAEWFEAEQFIAEAIQHALAAGDQERAARLVEQNALGMLMRGELVTLLGWIAAIEPAARGRPWTCIYQAWALTLTGQFSTVEPWLEAAERLVAARPANPEIVDMRGHIAAIRAYGIVQSGDVRQAVAYAQQALEHLPADNLAVRSVVTMALGSARRVSGDLAGASRALQEAVRDGQAAGNFYLALGALSGLADLWFDQGKLHQAEASYHELLRLATRPDGKQLPAAGMALFGLSLIAYEWNELDRAQELIQQAIALCQPWGHVGILMASQVMSFRIQQAQGQPEPARAALREAERLARDHPQPSRATSWVQAYRVRLLLAQGDLEGAARQMQLSELAPEAEIAYLREAEVLAQARLLLAGGDGAGALGWLESWQAGAEQAGRRGSLIEILALKAVIFLGRDDLAQALAALERALALAEPEGYLRTFLDEGAPMAELLRHAASQGIAPHYVVRLLEALEREAGPGEAPQQPLIEPLSERELEVLRLVAAGHSNQEIAGLLFLSIGTVKSHLSHIFGKLNVDNRTQCVARARQLNLL